MTTDCINLIPPQRRMARRQRARMVRWALVCALYSGAAIAIAPALSSAGAGTRAKESQRVRLEREMEIAMQASAEIAREHKQLMQSSKLLRELDGSADWGRLLSAVAATIGSDAALEGLTLAPRDKDPGAYTLKLTGLAVSQPTVTRLALQLKELSAEGEPLFTAVTISESRRRVIDSTPAVAFTIECALREPEEQERKASGKAEGAATPASEEQP